MCSIRFLLAVSIATSQLWYVEAYEYSGFVIGRNGRLCRPRLCNLNCDYGLRLDDNGCPICDCVDPFIFATTPETETETTTPEATQPPTTTPPPTTTTEEEPFECERCSSLCMFGYEQDAATGCNVCDRCVNIARPRPTGGRVTSGRGSENSLEATGEETSEESEETDGDVIVTEENGREMEKDCEFACIAQWEPVCGRNSKTYSNVCVKRQAECKSGSKIMLSRYGEC